MPVAMTEAPQSVPPAAGRRGNRTLVSVLVGVTMVTGIISSLGAPLIPSVARTLAHLARQRAVVADRRAAVGAVAAPIMGRLGRRAATGGRRSSAAWRSCSSASIDRGTGGPLPVLVVGRAMQGVGLGLAPVTMAAARDHLPPSARLAVIGMLSVAGAAGGRRRLSDSAA